MPLLKEESGKNNSAVALLLIDVINDLDFERADELLAQALPMARKIAALKREAAHLRIPTVYVNDNFGQWKSDFRHTVEHSVPAIRAAGRFRWHSGPRSQIISCSSRNIPASMQRRSMSCSNISKWTR
jgi:nicotinamidase-related amidase